MQINLLAEARGEYRAEFLRALLAQSNNKIDLVLHFGDEKSDFDVPSLMRQEAKKAKSGRLFDQQKITGPCLDLLTNKDYEYNLLRYIDQHFRASSKFLSRSHKMITIHEYIDFYHILASAIADKIIAREVTHVLFFDIPHLAVDTIIYDVARALNLQIIILSQQFPNGVFSCSRIEDVGKMNLELMPRNQPKDETENTNLWYMNADWQTKSPTGKLGMKEILRFYKALLFQDPKSLLNFKFQRTLLSTLSCTLSQLPHWRSPFNKFFDFNWLEYLYYLTSLQETTLDLTHNYVYVPLHLQPEMTTSALGGEYRDQLLMLERLSAKLPLGWKILVKENPKQGPFARDPMFFHRFFRIDNVQMVAADANTTELSMKAKLVATVSGTAALEAVEMGVPSLIFGNAWFGSMHGVFKFDHTTDIETISKSKIDTELVKKQKRYIVDKLYKINIDKGFFSQVKNFNRHTNACEVGKVLCNILLHGEKLTFRNYD